MPDLGTVSDDGEESAIIVQSPILLPVHRYDTHVPAFEVVQHILFRELFPEPPRTDAERSILIDEILAVTVKCLVPILVSVMPRRSRKDIYSVDRRRIGIDQRSEHDQFLYLKHERSFRLALID